ncbi:MAG: DUF5939 domain-containing protein [Leptospira sp.]|nr:DUF5939 domain-containing protein [Leptospira sp.]
MQNVYSHFYCHLRRKEAEASLDDFIQVNFTIKPKIREIIFHDPL